MISQIGNKQRVAFSEQRLVNKKNLIAKRYTLSAKKGLTLIEVLIAVSILAIGIIGVLRAYAGSISSLEIGQYNIDAVNLLKETMADVEQTILEEGEYAPKSGSGNSDDFLWEWNIDSTETENFNELTLTISHNYNPRTISVKTYVVEPKEDEEEE